LEKGRKNPAGAIGVENTSIRVREHVNKLSKKKRRKKKLGKRARSSRGWRLYVDIKSEHIRIGHDPFKWEVT